MFDPNPKHRTSPKQQQQRNRKSIDPRAARADRHRRDDRLAQVREREARDLS